MKRVCALTVTAVLGSAMIMPGNGDALASKGRDSNATTSRLARAIAMEVAAHERPASRGVTEHGGLGSISWHDRIAALQHLYLKRLPAPYGHSLQGSMHGQQLRN